MVLSVFAIVTSVLVGLLSAFCWYLKARPTVKWLFALMLCSQLTLVFIRHTHNQALDIIALGLIVLLGPFTWWLIKSFDKSAAAYFGLYHLLALPIILAIYATQKVDIDLLFALAAAHRLLYTLQALKTLLQIPNINKQPDLFLWYGLFVAWGLVVSVNALIQYYIQLTIGFHIAWNALAAANAITSVLIVLTLVWWALIKPKTLLAQSEYRPSSTAETRTYNQLLSYMTQSQCYLNFDTNLQTLAKALETSPKILSLAINQCAGKNVRAFIREYRINFAKELLLKQPDQRGAVLAISLESGYATKSAFYEAFKQETGMTPSQYRLSLT